MVVFTVSPQLNVDITLYLLIDSLLIHIIHNIDQIIHIVQTPIHIHIQPHTNVIKVNVAISSSITGRQVGILFVVLLALGLAGWGFVVWFLFGSLQLTVALLR